MKVCSLVSKVARVCTFQVVGKADADRGALRTEEINWQVNFHRDNKEDALRSRPP